MAPKRLALASLLKQTSGNRDRQITCRVPFYSGLERRRLQEEPVTIPQNEHTGYTLESEIVVATSSLRML